PGGTNTSTGTSRSATFLPATSAVIAASPSSSLAATVARTSRRASGCSRDSETRPGIASALTPGPVSRRTGSLKSLSRWLLIVALPMRSTVSPLGTSTTSLSHVTSTGSTGVYGRCGYTAIGTPSSVKRTSSEIHAGCGPSCRVTSPLAWCANLSTSSPGTGFGGGGFGRAGSGAAP